MHVHDAEGWRLVRDPARQPFSVLLGGEGWAAEFRPEEAEALAHGLQRLQGQHQALLGSLMAEEAISLELEVAVGAGSLWLELEGDRQQWGLRFVLSPDDGQRAVEGSWTPEASTALLAALSSQWPAVDGSGADTRSEG